MNTNSAAMETAVGRAARAPSPSRACGAGPSHNPFDRSAIEPSRGRPQSGRPGCARKGRGAWRWGLFCHRLEPAALVAVFVAVAVARQQLVGGFLLVVRQAGVERLEGVE